MADDAAAHEAPKAEEVALVGNANLVSQEGDKFTVPKRVRGLVQRRGRAVRAC